MRLLFECTYVYEHPETNSGIQRVVRNVVRHLAATQDLTKCVPIILKNGKVYEVKRLAPTQDDHLQERFEKTRNRYWLTHHRIEHALGLTRLSRPSLLRRLLESIFRWGAFSFLLPYGLAMLVREPGRMHARMGPWFEALRNRYWLIHQQLEQRTGIARVRWLRWPFWQLFRAASLSFVLPWKLLGRMAADDVDLDRINELTCQQGDVLVLLDSSWHADFFAQVEQLKQQGIGVVGVIYDLIPLTHPQFCDEPLVKVFDTWFDWVSRAADGYIAISATIANEVRSDVHRRLGTEAASARWYDYFQLGSELDQAQDNAPVRSAVRALFDERHSAYLMVSTIEPRKNHAYLLDAFECLWAREPTTRATLCIVGRIGWKCAPLVNRIKNHPELGRRLFMFNDLNDSELECCYQHSQSLVFPSFVEGFGLPLVEAMQRGLPAMASDIPVFREIGADFLAYFQLDDPASLAALIQRFEASGHFPAQRKLTDWHWPGWRDSTRQLVERIATHTARHTPIAQRNT
ncbi:MAG: glycosyltransferase family 4 protein [Sterolibacterium sp.]|jgi:alpha-1,2-rhamnosyltransferase|nr:glycosyltransferase family 4 protein [Sterolibacterium sp.]